MKEQKTAIVHFRLKPSVKRKLSKLAKSLSKSMKRVVTVSDLMSDAVDNLLKKEK